jgi:hypothetical protein
MATHFMNAASVIACGKASAPDCSVDAEKVTCKNCLRSQAFTQRADATEQALKSAAPVAAAPVETAAKPALSVVAPVGSGKSPAKDVRKAKHAVQKPAKGVAFAEWRQRFGANDRLPRGKAFASM